MALKYVLCSALAVVAAASSASPAGLCTAQSQPFVQGHQQLSLVQRHAMVATHNVSSEETAQCEAWCPIDARAWELKCTMDKCNGCSHCAKTGPVCDGWCWTDARAWDTKCTFSAKCADCAPCSSTWSSHGKMECAGWCEADSRSWDTKCAMQTCHKCSMCRSTGPACEAWCWTDTRAWTNAKCSYSQKCGDCAPCSSGWSTHGKRSSSVQGQPKVLTAVEDNHKVDVMVQRQASHAGLEHHAFVAGRQFAALGAGACRREDGKKYGYDGTAGSLATCQAECDGDGCSAYAHSTITGYCYIYTKGPYTMLSPTTWKGATDWQCYTPLASASTSASGDPHLINARGEKFDIFEIGQSEFNP